MKRLATVKSLLGVALLAGASLAGAQGQAIPGAPPSAAKKELVQRLLTLQQPSLENVGRDLAERPARQLAGEAEQALMTRVPADKREAAAKQIQELLRKYGEESLAVVRDRTSKINQANLAPMVDEKFTEEELRQLLASLESPVFKKYQQTQPAMVSAYAQTLVKELEAALTPKLQTLEQSVVAALGITPTAASQPKAAKPAAAAASKPAKK
ncbi:MAG: hypothetical protein H7Z15_16050 [Rhizobacter sp.]|nr:hypothetical protein [Rhizobacter sp.]